MEGLLGAWIVVKVTILGETIPVVDGFITRIEDADNELIWVTEETSTGTRLSLIQLSDFAANNHTMEIV